MLADGKYAAGIYQEYALTKSFNPTEQISSDAAAREATARKLAELVPAAAPAVSNVSVLVRTSPRAVDSIVLAQQRLRTLQYLRGFLSAGILSVAAWVAYRGSWWGTVNDLAGLAVVAFFTDFTIDAVVNAVTALKKPAGS